MIHRAPRDSLRQQSFRGHLGHCMGKADRHCSSTPKHCRTYPVRLPMTRLQPCANHCGLLLSIVSVDRVFALEIIPPRVSQIVHTTRGIFPFRFGRQPCAALGAVGGSFLPCDLLTRAIWSIPMAWLRGCAAELGKLCVGYFSTVNQKRPIETYPCYRSFAGCALLIAHIETSRRTIIISTPLITIIWGVHTVFDATARMAVGSAVGGGKVRVGTRVALGWLTVGLGNRSVGVSDGLITTGATTSTPVGATGDALFATSVAGTSVGSKVVGVNVIGSAAGTVCTACAEVLTRLGARRT